MLREQGPMMKPITRQSEDRTHGRGTTETPPTRRSQDPRIDVTELKKRTSAESFSERSVPKGDHGGKKPPVRPQAAFSGGSESRVPRNLLLTYISVQQPHRLPSLQPHGKSDNQC